MFSILSFHVLSDLIFSLTSGKGVEDAKVFTLDKAHKYLEKPKSYVQVLFADFSSPFNKMPREPYRFKCC